MVLGRITLPITNRLVKYNTRQSSETDHADAGAADRVERYGDAGAADGQTDRAALAAYCESGYRRARTTGGVGSGAALRDTAFATQRSERIQAVARLSAYSFQRWPAWAAIQRRSQAGWAR